MEMNRLKKPIQLASKNLTEVDVMLQIGDKVKMNDKYYVSDANKEKVFIVKTEPQEVCGTNSVWLEGYRGCYAVDGLTKLN